MRALILTAILCLVSGLTGCQCCTLTERCADHIDDISDHPMCFDDFYCEKLDLTRLCMNRRCCPDPVWRYR